MGVLDHISRDEFQNLRHDVAEHFKALHECDRRIERKLDELAAALEPVVRSYDEVAAGRQQRKNDRREVRMLALGAAIGAGFSVAAALLLFMIGLRP